jgi:hypothetical protein
MMPDFGTFVVIVIVASLFALVLYVAGDRRP